MSQHPKLAFGTTLGFYSAATIAGLVQTFRQQGLLPSLIGIHNFPELSKNVKTGTKNYKLVNFHMLFILLHLYFFQISTN